MKITLNLLLILALYTPTLAHACKNTTGKVTIYTCVEARQLDGYTAVFVEKGTRLSIRALNGEMNPKLRIEMRSNGTSKVYKGRAQTPVHNTEGEYGFIKSKSAGLDMDFPVVPFFKEVSSGQEYQIAASSVHNSDEETLYLCDQEIIDLFAFEECR